MKGRVFKPSEEDAIRKKFEDETVKSTLVVDYSPFGSLADPNIEYDRLIAVASGNAVSKTSLQNDMTCMLPVLLMFRRFSAVGKPTKFVMTCNIRQELEFAEQTENTLQFADTVKST